jgi:hypothetical protein
MIYFYNFYVAKLPKNASLFQLTGSSCHIFLYAYIHNAESTLSSNPYVPLCMFSWRSYATNGGQSAFQRRWVAYLNSGWAASRSRRSGLRWAARPRSSWWSWATAGARQPCLSAAWWRRSPWQLPSDATARPKLHGDTWRKQFAASQLVSQPTNICITIFGPNGPCKERAKERG